MIAQVKQLISVAKGNLVAVGELADAASGGHLAEFFKTSDERFHGELSEEFSDRLAEMAKLTAYNGTAIKIVLEIIELMLNDESAVAKLQEEYRRSGEEPPDARDVVVGASKIGQAYASSTAPLRRIYVQALRGSYAPEIFTFGFGPTLLQGMIDASLTPVDVVVLSDLNKHGQREIRLGVQLEALESYERLAAGDFAELMQDAPNAPRFILHRTQAIAAACLVRITPKGKRLLTMLEKGRG